MAASNYFKVAVWAGGDIERFRRHGPLRHPRRNRAVGRDRSDGRSLDEGDGVQIQAALDFAEAKLVDLRAAGAAPLLSVFRRIPSGPPVIGQHPE